MQTINASNFTDIFTRNDGKNADNAFFKMPNTNTNTTLIAADNKQDAYLDNTIVLDDTGVARKKRLNFDISSQLKVYCAVIINEINDTIMIAKENPVSIPNTCIIYKINSA